MTSVRTTETFEIGRVLSRAFGVMARNIALFLGLALILAGVPKLIGGFWRLQVADPRHPASGAAILAVIVATLLTMIGSAILQVAITRATVGDLNGETPRFAACLKAGIALLLPMIGLTILSGLGIGLAFLLLVVPGVMLFVAWSVAVPAYVQERLGITRSLGRSRALTKGHRWKIFALFLVSWIAIFALQLPASLATAVLRAPPLLAVFVATIVTVLGAMVVATIQATVYVELRDVKEGVAPSDLATIFA